MVGRGKGSRGNESEVESGMRRGRRRGRSQHT